MYLSHVIIYSINFRNAGDYIKISVYIIYIYYIYIIYTIYIIYIHIYTWINIYWFSDGSIQFEYSVQFDDSLEPSTPQRHVS